VELTREGSGRTKLSLAAHWTNSMLSSLNHNRGRLTLTPAILETGVFRPGVNCDLVFDLIRSLCPSELHCVLSSLSPAPNPNTRRGGEGRGLQLCECERSPRAQLTVRVVGPRAPGAHSLITDGPK